MKNYLKNRFFKIYKEEPDKYLSCGGRFELLGNHTDHNHGLCIAATCNLSIYAAVKKRNDLTVRFYSEGFEQLSLDLSNLDNHKQEIGKSSALIRGIAYYLSKNYKYGGFDVYLKSEIPSGAGVSSSAAFELLIAQTINILFNEEKIPLMTLCKASQFAEREYYGKMCGLLDQIGVAYGGFVYIDFKEISNPYVEPFKLNCSNYQFVIVNSGGSHASLSHLYSAIPEDMFKVANYFNKDFLREIDYQSLLENKVEIINQCGLIPYQRAEHFFKENKRVEEAIKAIKNNDLEKLITLINESRISSTELLHNMYVNKVEGSPLEACQLVMQASDNKAGVKINGGGFAGSIIALVPKNKLDNVINAVSKKYGKENVHLIDIRNDIPSELD